MNINRDYLIINDVKKSNIKLDNGSMFFYITDKNTQNIFVNLVINVSNNDLIQKYANIENAEDYTLTMNIVKPDNTYKVVEGKLHDKEKAIFEFDLNEDCCDEIGTYRCELLTKCTINGHEEITTSNKLTYKVKSSVLNDLDDIVEAPEYPLVIQLFDKLSDIDQYEEDRRANELARQLAEEQRQTRFNTLDADITDSIEEMDNKVVDVEARISAKEQAVDKLIVDTKVDIDDYKVAKDTEIDEYKTAKDTEINEAITAQDNKIDTAISNQNDRITVVENNVVAQNGRLDTLENKDTLHESRLDAVETKNTEQDGRLDVAENRLANIGNDITNTMQPIIDEHTSRLDAIEAIDVAQNNRLDAIEIKNQQQDDRLLDVEKVNKRQDMDLKCLFTESKNNMIDVTEEGNSVYLQNSTVGYTLIDEIQGNTMVNCNKEPDKELILNGNINTSGDNTVTLTEGVDGGLVDVALEGNTLVNVSKTKDSVVLNNLYTVENSGNHIALQGDVDSNCRPVITGNTLWIDNDTEEILTAFGENRNLRLQSTFEDNLVTQEMVDNEEEVADNLGKYRVDYKSTREDGTVGSTKILYLNSPLLEGDTIEEKDDGIYHVHRYVKVVLDGVNNSGMSVYNTKQFNDARTMIKVLYTRKDIKNIDSTTVYDNSLCDKLCWKPDIPNKASDIPCYGRSISSWKLMINIPVTTDSNEAINAYLQSNPLTFILPLETPTYELIEQSNLAIPSYANGYLDLTSAVPIEKVVIISQFEEELTYLYANTQYTVQFVSDAAIEADITLGGTKLLAQSIVAGLNKITITTPSELVDNKLVIDGVGANISKVVVTQATEQDFGYFEGMKSVGECEDLEVASCNKNLWDYNKIKPTSSQYLELIYSNRNNLTISLTDKDTSVDISGCSFGFGRNGKFANWLPLEDGSKIVGVNMIRIYPNKQEIIDKLNARFNIQIEEGLTATDYIPHASNTQTLTHEPLRSVGDIKDKYVLIDGKWYIERKCGVRAYQEGDIDNYITDMINTVYPLSSPTYEPIDYNPFEVYSDVTHISNNSTIPCNMTIKNTGFNCLLKPSTTYTVSSNLGLNTVTTPTTLTEDCLRFYDTDTSDVTTMKNVMVLEGDYTTGKPLPSHFSGIESAFEQEHDETVGKYKVKIRVQNEDASKENYIEFYINEPLRGVGDVKDKVYVKDDKVVVERNCGQRVYQDGDFGTYLTDKVNTVYPLAEPTYEEVEYNDAKLFIESFKSSTLFYNSNVPVTSKLYYSYSVPLVDTVAQTASISDQQDSMIIDMATQVAVMEMMLM